MSRLVVAAIASTLALASCRLLNHEVDCENDHDCAGFGVCVAGVCEAGEGEGAREGEGAPGEGEGEGTVGEGEGEGSSGEGEGEGEGPPPTQLFDAPSTITAATQPAMCAGKTLHVPVDLTAIVDVDVAFSSTSNAITIAPPTSVANAGDPVSLDVAWEIGAPPGVNANLDIHDNASGNNFSIPIQFVVDNASATLVNVPAVAKHDVLYVLDDSASMQTQPSLLASMTAHLNAVFASPTPDLRFAVTDIDDANGQSVGPFGDPRLHNGPFVDMSSGNARTDLDTTVNDLWGQFLGSGQECPLGAMVDSFGPGNTQMASFLRSDAALHIIYIGDSPDQTPALSTAQAESALDSLVLDNKTLSVHVHAIASAGASEDCTAPLDVDAKMDAVVANESPGDESATICDVNARNAALARIAARLRLPIDDVLLPACDAGSAIVCVRNGDKCEPIAGGIEDDSTCDVRLAPADADVIAGKTVLVAKGAACAL